GHRKHQRKSTGPEHRLGIGRLQDVAGVGLAPRSLLDVGGDADARPARWMSVGPHLAPVSPRTKRAWRSFARAGTSAAFHRSERTAAPWAPARATSAIDSSPMPPMATTGSGLSATSR